MSMSFMMSRVAIIIGAPGTPYLSGVHQDFHNWYKHLRSPQGGSWKKHEIISFWQDPKQTKSTDLIKVLHTVRDAVAEYCLVIFSGHGGENQLDNRSPYEAHNIFLTPSIYCPIGKLRNASSRQLIIADSCRTDAQGIGLGDYFLPERNLSLFNIDTGKAFMKEVRSQPYGRVLIQACKKGQTAQEDGIGGHFTQSLFRWMWEVDHTGSDPYFVDSYEATKNAASIMRSIYPSSNQEPITYIEAQEHHAYPLGIRFSTESFPTEIG